MKAWLLDQIGDGVKGLRIGTVTDPAPEAGEAVLEMAYAALNPADRYLAEGQYPAKPPLPHILGRDGIGTVMEVGTDVKDLRPGDKRVILRSEIGVSRPGTFAERVAVPVESLVPVPAGWSDEQAGGAPLVYLTAYQALSTWGDLPPSVVLITGASGGVGLASIQLARAMGHTTIALSRDERKREELERIGAGHALDPTDPQWPQTLKKMLGRRRVDLAIDNIGGPLFNQLLETLGEHGRVSCVGRLAGPVPEFNTAALFFRRLRIGGVAVGAYTAAESREVWGKVLALLARTGDRPLIDRVFPFEKLPDAFERLRQGPMGKVVLAVDGGK
jgi:NADPH:quinone reductase